MTEPKSTTSTGAGTIIRRPPAIPTPVPADRVADALEELRNLTVDESMAAWAAACRTQPLAAGPVNAAASVDHYNDILRCQQHQIQTRLADVERLAEALTMLAGRHPAAASDPDVAPRLDFITHILPTCLAGQVQRFDERIGGAP